MVAPYPKIKSTCRKSDAKAALCFVNAPKRGSSVKSEEIDDQYLDGSVGHTACRDFSKSAVIKGEKMALTKSTIARYRYPEIKAVVLQNIDNPKDCLIFPSSKEAADVVGMRSTEFRDAVKWGDSIKFRNALYSAKIVMKRGAIHDAV